MSYRIDRVVRTHQVRVETPYGELTLEGEQAGVTSARNYAVEYLKSIGVGVEEQLTLISIDFSVDMRTRYLTFQITEWRTLFDEQPIK